MAHLLPMAGAAIIATLCTRGRAVAGDSMGKAESAVGPEWRSSSVNFHWSRLHL